MIQTRQVNVERWSITSTECFKTILARIEREIGRPDMTVFWQKAASAGTLAELEGVVNDSIGPVGLMEFVRFDLGAILRKATGANRTEPSAGRRQSAHHERDGETYSGCRFLRSSHRAD
jgi:hypothetical protein